MRSALPLLLVFVVLFSIPASESAVSSIDLGSEWLKMAVVNLKPGQSPISVAINEMSKRKSPALVAFHGGNRLVGEEAAGISARYPDKVYSLVRDMIGKPYDHVKKALEKVYLPFDLVEDSRGAASIRIDDDVTVYKAEELLAMVFGYGMGLAEAHARVKVKDAVVAVPPYFGQAERKGVVQAAELAGMNVLGLINEHAGAALQYGIDKNFANDSKYVVFYDMGAGSTYAALVYFSAYSAKEYGKTVSVNQFQVIDVKWNADIGGQTMESRLIEYFADEFNKQVGNDVDVRKFPKAMSKLKKQVKRTKEILSANTAALISVESLHDDRDFRSTISREKFEELCEDLWTKALDPLVQLFEHSDLKKDGVTVELIGGATRVPKLQSKLQEFFGRNDLGRHIDADEGIVLGSALHAANLSDGIKLNRKLGMIDGSSYGFTIKLDGSDLAEEDSTEQLLVQRMKKLPSKAFRSIKHSKDFEVSLGYESKKILPPGVYSQIFGQFAVTGLTDAVEKYSSRNLSAPIKANMHFSLSRSGILSFDRAEAVIEYSEWIEVPKKNITIETSTNTTTNTSSEANSTKSEEKVNTESETNNSTVEGQTPEQHAPEKKLKKRTFRVPLKIVDKTTGPAAALSKESLAEAKTKLDELNKKDTERRRTAELKNNLEEYIYSTRGKLEDSSEIEKVSTEKERKSFMDKLEEVQEWLYTDGEDATASEFQERLSMLKSIGDPIFFRLKELDARPVASQHAKNYLGELKKIVNDWEKNKSWLPKSKTEEVLESAERVKTWLELKEALQEKTPTLNGPAFTSEEVYEKIFDLQDKVAAISRIPKPKPKIEKPPKGEKTTEQECSNASNTTTGDDIPKDQPKETETSSDTNAESEAHDEL